MIDDEIEALIDAIENSTRREILRELTADASYAMELSRLVGVSQQAINKHLEMLEKANLIKLMQDEENGRKKIYLPQGFSSLIIDYSQHFFNVTKKDLEFDGKIENIPDGDLFGQLKKINSSIDEVTNERVRLLRTKDQILQKIHLVTSAQPMDPVSRKIVNLYVESMDPEEVSRKTGMPEIIVRHVLTTCKLLK